MCSGNLADNLNNYIFDGYVKNFSTTESTQQTIIMKSYFLGIYNKIKTLSLRNGSTDNFVVRVSETPEATAAVAQALKNEYGNLDNIRYFAMDINLYDETGKKKITDTEASCKINFHSFLVSGDA